MPPRTAKREAEAVAPLSDSLTQAMAGIQVTGRAELEAKRQELDSKMARLGCTDQGVMARFERRQAGFPFFQDSLSCYTRAMYQEPWGVGLFCFFGLKS